jgi:hypothetical protein
VLLADHLVEVSMAEKARGGSAPYTAADAEAAKRELRPALQPSCAKLSRAALRCAMAANSSSDLAGC